MVGSEYLMFLIFLSFSFGWSSGNIPFFRVGNCRTKGQNSFMWNTHRWSRELDWGAVFTLVHQWHCPSQQAPQQEPEASVTCSISTSTCVRNYAVTHSSSSQWMATWQKVCMLELQIHSSIVSFHRSITLVVVPLSMPDKCAKDGSLLAWESALKWGKYLRFMSLLHLTVDTRTQSALSV